MAGAVASFALNFGSSNKTPSSGFHSMSSWREDREGESPPRPLQAAETDAGVDDGGAHGSHTASSAHEEAASDGDDMAEDIDDDNMDVVGSSDDDVRFNEEEVKFSKSSEFEAAVEALWRDVAAVEDKPSAGHACSVCMEPLTCKGAHRNCCIPCGHVYGRSCLERWLHRAGNKSAKCPQCGEIFEQRHITTLYAPGNLWDGCGHIQEVKVFVKKALGNMLAQWVKRTESWKTQAYSEIREVMAEQKAFSKRLEWYENEVKILVGALCEKIATAGADRVFMIDQMKKMAEEEGVTAKDVVEFVEQNYPRLPSIAIPQPPTSFSM